MRELAAEVDIAAAAARPAVIEVRGVSLTFATGDGPVTALADIDLAIAPGRFRLADRPVGLRQDHAPARDRRSRAADRRARLRVNGKTAEAARLDREYGYVFQAPALFPWRTVERNVMLPLEVMGLPAGERRERAARYLEMVNLDGFEHKHPWQLSGGMQQRASIARALSFEPKLLLMDEPFGALDEIVRDKLNLQLRQLWVETGKTVVFVTHSIPEAVFLSTRIVVMSPRPGRIIDVIEVDLPRRATARPCARRPSSWPSPSASARASTPGIPMTTEALAAAGRPRPLRLWTPADGRPRRPGRRGPVLVLVAIWYAATVWMNAPFARQIAADPASLHGTALVAATMSMERPVLPAPHQVVTRVLAQSCSPCRRPPRAASSIMAG